MEPPDEQDGPRFLIAFISVTFFTSYGENTLPRKHFTSHKLARPALSLITLQWNFTVPRMALTSGLLDKLTTQKAV